MAVQAQLYSENLGFALGAPQDLLMDNPNRGFNSLCFIPHQHQQHQLIPLDDQFQNQLNHNSFLMEDRIPFHQKNNMNHHQQSGTSTTSTLLHKHRMDVDRLISLQNERLRLALQHQRKQQMEQIMKQYESKTQFLLKQKEEEIIKAENRRIELEALLTRMEIENQTWQRAAKEKEAMVASLNGTIQRLRETGCLSVTEDAESCCCLEEEEEDDENEKKTGNWAQGSMKMVCRICNSRKSSVIILPCRHLCSCADCEPFLDSCPVCTMLKKASLVALI